jgi:hypothetical protein
MASNMAYMFKLMIRFVIINAICNHLCIHMCHVFLKRKKVEQIKNCHVAIDFYFA